MTLMTLKGPDYHTNWKNGLRSSGWSSGPGACLLWFTFACRAGDGTQSLQHARQALCLLSHISQHCSLLFRVTATDPPYRLMS